MILLGCVENLNVPAGSTFNIFTQTRAICQSRVVSQLVTISAAHVQFQCARKDLLDFTRPYMPVPRVTHIFSFRLHRSSEFVFVRRMNYGPMLHAPYFSSTTRHPIQDVLRREKFEFYRIRFCSPPLPPEIQKYMIERPVCSFKKYRKVNYHLWDSHFAFLSFVLI